MGCGCLRKSAWTGTGADCKTAPSTGARSFCEEFSCLWFCASLTTSTGLFQYRAHKVTRLVGFPSLTFFLKLLTRVNSNKNPTESYITVKPSAAPVIIQTERKQHHGCHTFSKLRIRLEKEMIQKPQVLSTRLLCLAGSPRARALARQQESKARLKLGINSELGSAQHSMLIYTTGISQRRVSPWE